MASGTDDLSIREFAASRFLKGRGIEIGALDKPMPMPKGATVKYVDRMSTEELLIHYPDYKGKKLVHVDIIDDGQELGKIPASSQDFVIANHFLEHCPNPIRSLNNMLRILSDGGHLFLTIPDKRYTFDVNRPVTPFEHVLKDFREGPDGSRRAHFEEWVKLVEKVSEPEGIKNHVDRLLKIDYSIHYHVWTQKEFIELILKVGTVIDYRMELEMFLKNGQEMVVVFTKAES